MKAIGNFFRMLVALFACLVFFADRNKDIFLKNIIVCRPGDPAPFPVDPALTGIVIAYRNPALIADEVCPRVMVNGSKFKYLKHKLADGFTVPDTKVGRKSRPNQVEFSATEETSAVQDYGLEDAVPQEDIDNAPSNYDPLGRAAEGIADLIALDREIRVSNLLFSAANYTYKSTLSGDSQFSSANSTPIKTILAALEDMIVRANVLVFGQSAWTQFRQNPEIVSAVLGNSGTKGVVTKEQVAALFEVDRIVVGKSYVNSAKKGQTVSMSRVWGKHLAMLAIDNLADTTNSRISFALTAQWGQKVARRDYDKNIGLHGGEVVKAGESVKELIIAKEAGYFFENAVA
jgi:hypothetical protein